MSRTVQPDLALGGPLLPSRAWFFGTFRYTSRLTGISRSSTLLDNLEALVPGSAPFNNEGRLKFGSLKGTAQLTPNHHFQVTYQRDANVEETNFQVNGANFQITALGGATYGTRLSSVWGDRVTTKILVGFNEAACIEDWLRHLRRELPDPRRTREQVGERVALEPQQAGQTDARKVGGLGDREERDPESRPAALPRMAPSFCTLLRRHMPPLVAFPLRAARDLAAKCMSVRTARLNRSRPRSARCHHPRKCCD